MTVNVDKRVLEKSKRLGLDVSHCCTEYLRTLNAELERALNNPPGKIQAGNISLDGFENWLLQEHSAEVSTYMVKYAGEFSHCLAESNLSALLSLAPGKKRLVMASLASLAKFTGVYDEWKKMLKRYNLNWSGKSKDEIFIERMTKIKEPGEIFSWVRSIKLTLPRYESFIDLLAVTGLRFIEAINAYNLIISCSRGEGVCLVLSFNGKSRLKGYYNTERKALEHFWFKDKFLRHTKKAFVSFVPWSIIQAVVSSNVYLKPDSVQNTVKRVLPLRFGDVREAHGTFLIKFLKKEEINFLHGRVSSDTFMQHYFNPALISDLKMRVFQGITEIQAQITK